MALLLLPIHLFDENKIKLTLETINKTQNANNDKITIYLLEEPVYFGDRDKMQLNFNKLKLIYHRATMQYYFSYLSTIIKSISANININPSIEYIEYNKLTRSSGYSGIKKHPWIVMFDPVDTYLTAKYKKLFASKLKPFMETPQFLCTSEDLAAYHKTKANKSSYFHANFYKWQRERLHILQNSKTYDTENREAMPLETPVPQLPDNAGTDKINKAIIEEAIKYVNATWPNNLEPVYCQRKEKPITAESILFPITHDASIKWLNDFCVRRFHLFGKYEDAIDTVPRNFLFHSCITPMLNIGLITPHQVVETISDYYNKNSKTIGIANYEGFIRQIIGWREYQRYIYLYAGEQMRSANYFTNTKKLSATWYSGTTGIKPVDDAIIMAMNDGYIHHILRLMVIGNFMNLVGIHPDEVYKWFMEFSLDSYDWVMIGNVYSMALWADGGLTMRKPYISGSGYILKMSNYNTNTSNRTKKIKNNKSKSKSKTNSNTDSNTNINTNTNASIFNNNWIKEWDAVFHHFIDRNSDKLRKTYYNGIVKAWDKKDKISKDAELGIANKLIDRLT